MADNLPVMIKNPGVAERHTDAELRREIKTRLYGEEPPLTTTRRSSGFSIEEDEAYRIAVWHYDYQGTRGDFWLNEDLATKRLRNKILGFTTPTPQQVVLNTGILDIGPGPLYRSHSQDNTRQNQKKRTKRRKNVLKKHRK